MFLMERFPNIGQSILCVLVRDCYGVSSQTGINTHGNHQAADRETLRCPLVEQNDCCCRRMF